MGASLGTGAGGGAGGGTEAPSGGESSGARDAGGTSGEPVPDGASGNAGVDAVGGTSGSAANPSLSELSKHVRTLRSSCETGELPAIDRRLVNRQYDHTVRDLLGLTTLDAYEGAAPSEVLAPDSAGVALSEEAENAYQAVARAIAQQVLAGPSRSLFIACDPAVVGCLDETLVSFGRKAFRRPLLQAERDELQAALSEVDGAEQQAEELLYRILASPHFFTLELGSTADQPAQEELANHALASRLSYFLWDSLPDAELNASADAGQLETQEQVSAQVERMMQDPRLHEAVLSFYEFYLGVGRGMNWEGVEHDPELFPGFTAKTKLLADEELRRFLDSVTFSEGGFADLFLSPAGFVNAQLAPFYGLDPADFGEELEAVELSSEKRPGFLTRLSFLSSFSHFQDSAPVLRGAFVTGRVLGLDPGAPDPAALKSSAPGDFATLRELITALTSPPACKTCHHVFLNPPGFALENYDAVGSFRTVDPRGGEIDPVVGVLLGDQAILVESPLDLMKRLADSAYAKRAFASQFVLSAFGAARNSAQLACVTEDLETSLEQDGFPLLDLWRTLAEGRFFRTAQVIAPDRPL